jgi:hypothetical protein
MTGDGRGLGEVKKGPGWIAMERREEKKRKISYRENLQKRFGVWGLEFEVKGGREDEPLAKFGK